MSPRRKDRVAPPPRPGGWTVRFGTNDAAKGWEELCHQAGNNTRVAWDELEANPAPAAGSNRHRQLKGDLAFGQFDGQLLPQWQYEVTGGGRIWYLLDRERRTLWVVHAGTGHPKRTE